ncbi:MAG: tetraacyldisaccharide 4'-kinase, partial [bacterium]
MLEELYKLGLFCHRRLSEPKRVPAFVISVGNITTGGTGKTQMVLKIAQIFKEKKVCILSRGYKGKYENKGAIVMPNMKVEDVGDEPLMLSKMCNIPVIVGKNRYKNAMFAISHLGVDTIILDDGFQHWGLFRNLDILLINGANPFGNYHLLPYGILREPLSCINRADIIIITKKKTPNLIDVIRKFNKTSPIFEADYKPSALLDNNGN